MTGATALFPRERTMHADEECRAGPGVDEGGIAAGDACSALLTEPGQVALLVAELLCWFQSTSGELEAIDRIVRGFSAPSSA
ncbi:hypothetical protein [Agromyces sp. Soil535]|uniref:hypothetical protein n=1 Tax=Agromyces sp. Soil535 TaxID=1736390 RepID=UPI0012E370A9|nr:hypothetical protein [Agromyces sp. Soil535]